MGLHMEHSSIKDHCSVQTTLVALSIGEVGDRLRPRYGKSPKLCQVNWLDEEKLKLYL